MNCCRPTSPPYHPPVTEDRSGYRPSSEATGASASSAFDAPLPSLLISKLSVFDSAVCWLASCSHNAVINLTDHLVSTSFMPVKGMMRQPCSKVIMEGDVPFELLLCRERCGA